MKKTKKALASLAIAGMALTMVPFNAFATGTVPNRLFGTTAAQTAVAIAEQTGWTGTAILASSASYGMVDALTSGPLAKLLNAPILLQEPGAVLNADTKAELTKLAVKKVYVTSGTAVISQTVLDQLSGMGITVESLGGADRFETSVNIAKKMVALGAPVAKVAVAYGWLNQDALSIAAIASASSSPILLTEKNTVPAGVSAFLAANTAVKSSDVIGGTAVISDTVKAALPNATRHAGTTAYDTNNQVIQDFADALTFTNVYVANGVTGIDALSGAPLAAMTTSPIVLTDGTVPLASVFVHSKLATTGAVVTALGGTAVVSDAVLAGVRDGSYQQNGTLSVTSVTAASATSFKVVFSQAPTDTSKVVFAVARSTTPVTTTTTWNTANTEATVTSASNFPEGSYTVNVKDNNTDLGTSTVAITQQKIASINITSTKLGVTTVTTGSALGYATYNVLDQYGVDITTSSLANSLTFQTGVGTASGRNGLITVTPSANINLMTFSSVVITGYDSASGISTSATLTTTTQVGTLSDLTLTTLTNVDSKVLTAGDTADIFYLGYTATDVSGNPTTNFSLVKSGLILQTGDYLTTSANSYLTAQVVQDPNDSNKAVIQVKATSQTVTNDMPVVITAMTWTGKTSSFNLTLKKAAAVDSFTLMTPAYDIAVGESKDIPFTAVDQNGVALTNYGDISGMTFTGATPYSKVDGTFGLRNVAQTNDGSEYITAMTSTGHYSSISINIQKAAVADTLSLDSSVLVNSMQSGATQGIDFGYNYKGFTVKDQYGRVMDMTGAPKGYQVIATSNSADISVYGSDPAKGTVGTGAIAFGGNGIQIKANATNTVGGSGTVTFQLVNTIAADGVTVLATPLVIDTKSASMSVVKDSDIKGYKMDTVATPIYATVSTTGAAITGRQASYDANPYVYGTTTSGSKVILGGTPVIGVNVDNTTDFTTDGTIPSTGVDYESVNVAAKTLANNVTSSSTNLSVTILGADGAIHVLSTPLKSTTVTPVNSTIGFAAGTFLPGITADTTIADTYTVNASYLTAGKSMARFDQNGSDANRAKVYFYGLDQYGTKATQLSQILKVAQGSTGNFALDQYGNITTGATAGDKIILSAVSNNLVKTVVINVK